VPIGYALNSVDCYDKNELAHPGSEVADIEDRGDGSFDFDCNGFEDLSYRGYAECSGFDNACPPPNTWPDGFSCDYETMVTKLKNRSGWTPGHTIPACGKLGMFGLVITWDAASSQYMCSDPILDGSTYQTCH
jgi:hypothetical protein